MWKKGKEGRFGGMSSYMTDADLFSLFPGNWLTDKVADLRLLD